MSNETQNNPIKNEALPSALGEILSNPQMLTAISSMAEKLKAGSAATESTADSDKKADSGESQSKLPDVLSLLQGKGSGESQSRRSELLCALKPYLSQNRSEAIDKIIRLSELSGVFKELS